MFTCHRRSPANDARLSSCHGDSRVFSTVVKVASSTFCCYHRRRLLTADESRPIFESALERVRCSFRLRLWYVVMPEHVHLLLSEPHDYTSVGRVDPLKPKEGLNGPPVRR